MYYNCYGEDYYEDKDRQAVAEMFEWLNNWWWTFILIFPLIPFLIVAIFVYAILFAS